MITTQIRSESPPRTVICTVCKTKFETTHSQGKYCSDQCRQAGARKSWNKYDQTNKVKRRMYQRRHYKDNKVERTAQIKVYQMSPRGKEVQKASDLNSKMKYPEKYDARQKVLIAKRSGIIVQMPCIVCGNPITEAHHINYNNPLDVEWLCNKHHREVHQSNKLGVFIQEGEIKHINKSPDKLEMPQLHNNDQPANPKDINTSTEYSK